MFTLHWRTFPVLKRTIIFPLCWSKTKPTLKLSLHSLLYSSSHTSVQGKHWYDAICVGVCGQWCGLVDNLPFPQKTLVHRWRPLWTLNFLNIAICSMSDFPSPVFGELKKHGVFCTDYTRMLFLMCKALQRCEIRVSDLSCSRENGKNIYLSSSGRPSFLRSFST